jgi:hypothetical protein
VHLAHLSGKATDVNQDDKCVAAIITYFSTQSTKGKEKPSQEEAKNESDNTKRKVSTIMPGDIKRHERIPTTSTSSSSSNRRKEFPDHPASALAHREYSDPRQDLAETSEEDESDDDTRNRETKGSVYFYYIAGALYIALVISAIIVRIRNRGDDNGSIDNSSKSINKEKAVPTAAPTSAPSVSSPSSSNATLAPTLASITSSNTTNTTTVLSLGEQTYLFQMIAQEASRLIGIDATRLQSPSPVVDTLNWLANQDSRFEYPLTYDSEDRAFVQRYTSALLLFTVTDAVATNGTSGSFWQDTCHFLNGSLPECDWHCLIPISSSSDVDMSNHGIQGLFCENGDNATLTRINLGTLLPLRVTEPHFSYH